MENDSKRASKTSSDKGTDVNDENPDAVNGVIVIDDVVEEQQKEEAQENGSEQGDEEEESQINQPSTTRTPFTDLSQVDADAALARTLQEQERAYMMLRINTEGSDYGSWEDGSYLHDEEDDFSDPNDESDVDAETEEAYDGTDVDDEEDAFDVHAHAEDDDTPAVEYDPEIFSSDEAYARALQDAEDREMAARMLAVAGISEVMTPEEVQEMEEHPLDLQLQNRWEEVDPDELSYEELLALGEVVGSESRGLPTDTIASLPSVQYKTGSSQHGSSDSCVICRFDYEEEETLTMLSCKHSYHSECINNWLEINKVCPVCSAEVVATGGNS